MADYVTSAYLAAQEKINEAYAQHEQREKQYPILAKGLASAPMLYTSASLESLKQSEKRTVKLYQFTRTASTGGTAQTHNPSGSQGDTAEITPSFNTLTEEFALYMNAGKDNVFSNADMLRNALMQKMRTLRERAGLQLLTDMWAGRTTVAASGLQEAEFDATNNVFKLTDAEEFFAKAQNVMFQHDYPGTCDMLIGPGLRTLAKKVANQGTGNGVNMQWQMEGLNILSHSVMGNSVANEYSKSALVLPENSFAYVPWQRADFIAGGGDFEAYNGGRTVINDDVFGESLQYMLFGRTEGANGASNGGTVNDLKTTWQLTLVTAIQIAEISAAGESPAYGMALVA